MSSFTNKAIMALSLGGIFVLAAPAFAQNADTASAPAAAESANPSASDPSTSEKIADAAPANLGQGTKAQAEHSAEATAHKSVNDPNNQLGTSLQGRTRPVAGADADADAQNAASTAPPQ